VLPSKRQHRTVEETNLDKFDMGSSRRSCCVRQSQTERTIGL
jgi:hypothetical protein